MNFEIQEKLRAYIGQLTDLKQGLLKEIVITKGKDADILLASLMRELEEWRQLEALDQEMTRQEEREKRDIPAPPQDLPQKEIIRWHKTRQKEEAKEEIQSPKDEPNYYEE